MMYGDKHREGTTSGVDQQELARPSDAVGGLHRYRRGWTVQDIQLLRDQEIEETSQSESLPAWLLSLHGIRGCSVA